MPKVPKIKCLYIFEYLQKNVGDEVDFLPADEHENCLQVNNITLGVSRQAYSKYSK